MVKYYGRARQRIGSVNSNQQGLKMGGCPSKIGHSVTINNYIGMRVNCLKGICGGSFQNNKMWKKSIKNSPPYCIKPSNKCLAAAGGVGLINTPYKKTPTHGSMGC
jgi:uncharacterized protein YneF (UPF0154 family)